MGNIITIDKELEYAHLGLNLNEVNFDTLRNPFEKYNSRDDYMEILHIIRNIDNLYFTLKYIFNIEPSIFQMVLLRQFWIRPYPLLIASRGASKSYLLALYGLLRALITQGSKIVIVSNSFRQSKNVFDYAANIFANAPILRDICEGAYNITHGQDVHTFYLGDSTIKAVPIGTSGEKIRGLRSTHLIVDEFQSMNTEVYEVVVGGFGAVSSNPSQNVIKMAKVKLLKERGLWTKDHQRKLEEGERPNQTILSGTADWGFKDFAKTWKKWKTIILNANNTDRIRDELGDDLGDSFDPNDYCVMRLPYNLVPEGFMEAKHIDKAKATSHISHFQCEYGACFVADSDGFYKRTLIESCTTKYPIELPSGSVQFRALTTGQRNKKYVYGIDPASESDNFAIIILELHPDHRRIVNCWTTMRRKNIERGKNEGETDFYQFIARKIRNLMKIFPCEHIALDSQGGGLGVMEALHNLRSLEEGELPLWPILEDHPLFYDGSKNYGYDDEAGLHIIEMVSFAKTEYVVEANHGMKKDMEDKVLLFPSFNALELGLSGEEDKSFGRTVDTQEDVVLEIEELKEELSTISHMTTQTGKDKWDTPETTLIGNKKGRLRKDRYSALLIANMAARRINRPTTINHQQLPAGGSAYHIAKHPTITKTDKFYSGPDWYVNNPSTNFNNWGHGLNRGGGRGV